MKEAVSPINITAAALITQFSIIIIMFVGATILRGGEKYLPFYRDVPRSSFFGWLILTFALVTIGGLIFSDEFSSFWKPLFGTIAFPTIQWSVALLIMFTLNIICVSILVRGTGGSFVSPFSPIYFILPALAIFLREGMGRIIIYLMLVSIMFTLNLKYRDRLAEEVGGKSRSFAYWLVSILCFILATFIGYVTRP